MKRIITRLLPAIVLNTFLSAAPASCSSTVKMMRYGYVSTIKVRQEVKELFETHPLDLLSLKFE